MNTYRFIEQIMDNNLILAKDSLDESLGMIRDKKLYETKRSLELVEALRVSQSEYQNLKSKANKAQGKPEEPEVNTSSSSSNSIKQQSKLIARKKMASNIANDRADKLLQRYNRLQAHKKRAAEPKEVGTMGYDIRKDPKAAAANYERAKKDQENIAKQRAASAGQRTQSGGIRPPPLETQNTTAKTKKQTSKPKDYDFVRRGAEKVISTTKKVVKGAVKGAAKFGLRAVLGGVSEGTVLDHPTKTPEELAKKWKIDPSKMKSVIKSGTKVEKEHTKNKKVASEIARDHLGERPDYYKKLKQFDEVKNKNVIPPQGTSMNPLSTYGLNELSDNLIKRYVNKARNDFLYTQKQYNKYIGDPDKKLERLEKRYKGVKKAYSRLDETKNEKLTGQQIETLRSQYGSIKRIDPSAASYKKLVSLLDKLSQSQLKQLESAKIPFVSSLSRNRIKREGK